MKRWLLVFFLLLVPVCAARIQVSFVIDGTPYNGFWLEKNVPVTVANHTVMFASWVASVSPTQNKASFSIEIDGVYSEFYHQVQGTAFGGHGSLTVMDSDKATIIINDPYSRSYRLTCAGLDGVYSGTRTFSVFPGNCVVKPYDDGDNPSLWKEFVTTPGFPATIDIPNLEADVGSVYSSSAKQVRMDVRLVSDRALHLGGLHVKMDIDGMVRPVLLQDQVSMPLETGVVCDNANKHTVRFFLGNTPIGSRVIDCVEDFTFGIFNRYGYSSFLTESSDLLVETVSCDESRIRLKVSGTDSPPVIQVFDAQGGPDLPVSFSGFQDGFWEYPAGITGSMAEIRVSLPDGRRASSYCKKYGQALAFTVRFLTDTGLSDSVPFGTREATICADLPAWMYGEIVVLAAGDGRVLAGKTFEQTTNKVCMPVDLQGLSPQRLKVVLMVWGGMGLAPMYLNTMLAIRPNEVHVFRGGCTMCKVGLASFPRDVEVVEHEPTDADYLLKMLEYGIDFAPALVIPGEGRQYTLDEIRQETPSALEGMFRTQKQNPFVFVPSYRSFDLVSALEGKQSRVHELQGGTVVVYPVPGDSPSLGIIAIADHLPRAVSITPDHGVVREESLDSFGPVCMFLSKICSAQGCSFDCVKYALEANGTVTLSFSGALEGTVVEDVSAITLPDLEVEVNAPDSLLYGDTGTLSIAVSAERQPVDVVVLVESQGVGMTANKIATGYYSLDVGPGEYTILVSRLGYRTYFVSRSVAAINPLNFTAVLTSGTAGRTARAEVRVENVGRGKFWGVSTKVEIPALGVQSVSAMDYDLDPFIERVEQVDVLIPASAWPGEYVATITVGNAEFSNQENRTVTIVSEDVLINLMKAVRDWYDRLARRG